MMVLKSTRMDIRCHDIVASTTDGFAAESRPPELFFKLRQRRRRANPDQQSIVQLFTEWVE
jgi:hypothetical protein